MPSLEELKQRNKPEMPEGIPPAQPQQTVTVPYLPLVSAIPTDQWNMMVESQTAAIQRLQELAMYIATLPTVDDVNQMMKKYYSNRVYGVQRVSFFELRIREKIYNNMICILHIYITQIFLPFLP